MLTRLRLERFKNFKDAEIHLGPFSVLIGANASGKSNIRDALRFLHGISRGYTIPEILGEKYIEGGVLQWRGIRGGLREATYSGESAFAITVDIQFKDFEDIEDERVTYSIIIEPQAREQKSRVVREYLNVGQNVIFDSSFPGFPTGKLIMHPQYLVGYIAVTEDSKNKRMPIFSPHQPVLTQMVEHFDDIGEEHAAIPAIRLIKWILAQFRSMRFLDLDPEAMRIPSNPGQTILGDRGENLSSVLQAICEDPQKKLALVEWIQELTPMDVCDLEFREDLTGKILVYLVEENGQTTSAYSASDGTLRFLAMLAAFLDPNPSKFYFFEELENGLHPVRLHLLMELIENKASQGLIQTVATTHSPQLLRFLSKDSLEHASLLYRLPDSPKGRVKRIMDIPDIREILEEQDLAALHESGWFEDSMFFLEPEESE